MLPEPAITRDDARGLWRVDEDVIAFSRGYTLIVPKDFETDLASIPRVLWNVIAPFDLSCVAPIVHDWLYQHGGTIETQVQSATICLRHPRTFTRADADAFLLDLMTQEDVPAWRRQSAYWAVRLFGGSSWQSLPPSPMSTP